MWKKLCDNHFSVLHAGITIVLAAALVISTIAYNSVTSASDGTDPPYVPSNPFPENVSKNVSVNPVLSWTGGSPDNGTVTYDIYLGTNQTPSLAAKNISETFYSPGILSMVTTYYWQIIAWNNESQSASGPLWEFTTGTNLPPNEPKSPNPANGSTDVTLAPVLTWVGGDPDNDTVTYDVYFGTNQTPPLLGNNISAATYAPGVLNISTTYYWRIIAWDNHSDSTMGPLWLFTTTANHPPNIPSDPSPADGSGSIAITAGLSWKGGDPDDDVVTYDIYFGTTLTPPRIVNNQSSTTYSFPTNHTYSTTYYWRIIAWDNHSASTSGPLWKFTTMDEPEEINVVITKPVNNTFYLNNVAHTFPGVTFVYGGITITADVSGGAGIATVEFFIDNATVANFTSGPYEYNWSPIIQFNGLSLKHNIKVVATDTEGQSASAEINVTKWRFHILPALLIASVLVSGLITHTTMKGLVFNLRESGRGYTFFAVRMHYHTVGLLKNERGVIQMKRCAARIVIGPTMIYRLGPPHTLAYVSVTFLGGIHIVTNSLMSGLFSRLFQTQRTNYGSLQD